MISDHTGDQALAALKHWATVTPQSIYLETDHHAITFLELESLVAAAAERLAHLVPARLGLILDNGAAWVIADLAARKAGIVLVPIPAYFSQAQIIHVIESAGLNLLLTDQATQLLDRLAAFSPIAIAPLLDDSRFATSILLTLSPGAAAPLPAGTAKVTFTSGTTGTPKGACLTGAAMDQVAASLLAATSGSKRDRHMSLLPLAALLENLASIDITLRAGAMLSIPSLHTIGVSGSSTINIKNLLRAIDHCQPTSIVTVPQLLAGLMQAARGGWHPSYLRHIAVGGAPLARDTIAKARSLGLPVYEGYGLSECSSVVSLNTDATERPGSVGRVLPHADVRTAADGEILVKGALFIGYVGYPSPTLIDGYYPTGDIGHLDQDGFLYLTGRKRNIFITAYGRNIAPEWIECELTAHPWIAQAAVFGEARPWNVALILPRSIEGNWEQAVDSAIAEVNATLPDYARVRSWLRLEEPMQPRNGLITQNGRLRRQEIEALYGRRIQQLYQKDRLYVF